MMREPCMTVGHRTYDEKQQKQNSFLHVFVFESITKASTNKAALMAENDHAFKIAHILIYEIIFPEISILNLSFFHAVRSQSLFSRAHGVKALL